MDLHCRFRTMVVRLAVALAACSGSSVLAAAPLTPEEFRAADITEAENLPVRIVRFDALLEDAPSGSEQASRRLGQVTPMDGADPVFGSTPGEYQRQIKLHGDQKDGFVDSGTIRFSTGEIHFKGVYSTHYRPTPIAGVANLVMVEEVTGGTGAFKGVSGRFLLNSTLIPGKLRGAFNGVLYIQRHGN